MGLLDKLFGTTDAVKGLIEAGANTVDRFVLTKQEKLDYEKFKEEQEYRELVFDAEQKEKELQLNLEYYKTDALDRANARDLNKAELAQDDVFVKRFRYYLAAAWSLAAIAFMGIVTLADIPEKNIRNVDTIIGFLMGTIVTTIIAYFFGSSHNSSVKDYTIKKLA